jgi:hypothetical protein
LNYGDGDQRMNLELLSKSEQNAQHTTQDTRHLAFIFIFKIIVRQNALSKHCRAFLETNTMKMNILKFLAIGILLASQGCSLPEVKQAKFQRDSKEVINELKSLKDFEDAGIKWSAISSKNKTTNILIVQLLNGKDLGDNKTELRNLGNEAIKIVTNSIENESDYEKFQVVFVQKASTGPVTTSFTKQFEYSLDDVR